MSAAVGASRQQSQSDSDDLSAELIGELSDFESAVAINKFLANLLVLVTKGRVSPRRASVLAYITNQLLHSHRAINYDDQRHSDDHVNIILDGSRPSVTSTRRGVRVPPAPGPLGESDRDDPPETK